MYFVSSQDRRSVVAPDGRIICKATTSDDAAAIAHAMNAQAR